MSALSKDLTLRLTPADAVSFQDQDVKASSTIYNGSICGLSTGARALTAGDTFLGINVNGKVDNSAGAVGAKRVRLCTKGVVHGVTVAGASGIGDLGTLVYAASDNIADCTTTSSGNTAIGHIAAFDSATSTFSIAFTAKTHQSV